MKYSSLLRGCGKRFIKSVGGFLQLTVIVVLLFNSYLDVVLAQVDDNEPVDTEDAIEFLPGNFTSNLSSVENETSWEDGNWRRKDRSRIASVVVYSSVILIALFGVLVRYFVTQYETLQAKAQLEYQQLRNVQIQ